MKQPALENQKGEKGELFHAAFPHVSRMINTGVQSMARGLVTLQALGEDLRLAPMSIDDLINVGSYHFNKSYLGVLQTSVEISEKEAAVSETISSEPPEPSIKSPPAFTKILHQAACRSGGTNDGSIEITMEEMQMLLADPEFWEYEAKFAEMIQKHLPLADDTSE